jgi:hypothetical protein
MPLTFGEFFPVIFGSGLLYLVRYSIDSLRKISVDFVVLSQLHEAKNRTCVVNQHVWEDGVLTCTVKASSGILVQQQKEFLVRLFSILPRISKSHALKCFYWISNDVKLEASDFFDFFNQLN